MDIIFVWNGKNCPAVGIKIEDCTNRGRNVGFKMPYAKGSELKEESGTSHNQARS